MNSTVIRIQNVRKTYKKRTRSKTNAQLIEAVKDLTFAVEKASCFGLLGPNGAGKTTTMKMLYGKAQRDDNSGGSIEVFGYDPRYDELSIKYLCGVVPQDDNLDTELNVNDNLTVYCKLYGISKKDANNRIEDLLSFMELLDKRYAKIKELSGGMKRRLIICRALLNNPKLLILDEPTTGLDPHVRHHIWDKLRQLKKQGITILITTHYMDEAFQLCDSLAIMDKGRIVIHGNPIELIRNNIEPFVLEINDKDKYNTIRTTVENSPVRTQQSQTALFLYSSDIDYLKRLSINLNPLDYHIRQTNLEDIFLKVVGQGLTTEETP
ncbi:ABC-type multidrug transport system, ATPase component [Candidatus Magnetoovum chiemensis]|nr:ABC-type multidrug transport system, ATPase component [Candidatus Magnetoovum chiemensis]